VGRSASNYEALWMAGPYRSGPAAAAPQPAHQTGQGAGQEGIHGTIQDSTMHTARDKDTPLRNTIMKHRGSTQQLRYEPINFFFF